MYIFLVKLFFFISVNFVIFIDFRILLLLLAMNYQIRDKIKSYRFWNHNLLIVFGHIHGFLQDVKRFYSKTPKLYAKKIDAESNRNETKRIESNRKCGKSLAERISICFGSNRTWVKRAFFAWNPLDLMVYSIWWFGSTESLQKS